MKKINIVLLILTTLSSCYFNNGPENGTFEEKDNRTIEGGIFFENTPNEKDIIQNKNNITPHPFDPKGLKVSINMPYFRKKTSVYFNRVFIELQISRQRFNGSSFYSSYAMDNQIILDSIANAIAMCIDGEYDVVLHAQMIIDYVQNLDYIDDEKFGHEGITLFPVETIFFGGGDCEDKSILMYALLKTIRVGVVMIGLPGHVMVGALCDGCTGSFVEYHSKRYYVIESTSTLEIGMIDEDYNEQPAHVIP